MKNIHHARDSHSEGEGFRSSIGYKGSIGSTLLELIVTIGLLLFIVTTLFSLLSKSTRSNDNVKNIGLIQQHARATLNFVSRDLLFAGAEITVGGVPVPTQYRPSGILYPITPSYNTGPVINGQTNDGVTVMYSPMVMQKVDLPSAVPFQINGIAQDGSQITLDTTNGNPDASNLKIGDILLVKSNTLAASALGYVTSIGLPNIVNFAAGDPLNLNQPGPSSLVGNLSCSNQGGGVGCVTSAAGIRVYIAQYYLDTSVAVDPSDAPVLVRKLNGQSPSPVGLNIELFQLTYLSVNDVSGRNPTNPLNIRRANIALLARSRNPVKADGSYHRFRIDGSVATKNLAYAIR